MTQLVSAGSLPAPTLIAAAGDRAAYRFLEFFAAQIRNPHTRRAYAKAVGAFCSWLEARGLSSIAAVGSIHIAAYVEELGRRHAAPTVKQHLAAIRRLLDWLAAGGVLPFNPASAVRGPKHVVRRGKTAVLAPEEARQLLDSIDVSVPVGLRDRALIGLMLFTFARIGAATAMRVEDVYVQSRRLWVRLHEKGGKAVDLPCHHSLEAYLHAYLDSTGIQADDEGPLFRTIGRGTGRLTRTPLPAANAYAMVRRRAEAAGIATKIGNHTFRATGITAYLKNGGTLERAAAIAHHASTRTTQLYDRRDDAVNLDEIERIRI
ncbi:tyrosine-type recombinase/integrase [Methylobacterium soli]|uniref:Tyrosine-type recombinase/integrase n=1 Tax=Methylobacterium soli TaxID=553447 RepID=A0A6L3SWR6_9HYPH|nr:tyrosine-type recombinase/integrase [Methylobacterium soli]KAB1072235.1 tyrosine-type recombinase/integrase [Methylobacterium soli]GJE45309.1 Tyrosine recombinase XerC [Methylobacterium soli]